MVAINRRDSFEAALPFEAEDGPEMMARSPPKKNGLETNLKMNPKLTLLLTTEVHKPVSPKPEATSLPACLDGNDRGRTDRLREELRAACPETPTRISKLADRVGLVGDMRPTEEEQAWLDEQTEAMERWILLAEASHLASSLAAINEEEATFVTLMLLKHPSMHEHEARVLWDLGAGHEAYEGEGFEYDYWAAEDEAYEGEEEAGESEEEEEGLDRLQLLFAEEEEEEEEQDLQKMWPQVSIESLEPLFKVCKSLKSAADSFGVESCSKDYGALFNNKDGDYEGDYGVTADTGSSSEDEAVHGARAFAGEGQTTGQTFFRDSDERELVGYYKDVYELEHYEGRFFDTSES